MIDISCSNYDHLVISASYSRLLGSVYIALDFYTDKTQLLWKLLASQADRGASGDGVTEDGSVAVRED